MIDLGLSLWSTAVYQAPFVGGGYTPQGVHFDGSTSTQRAAFTGIANGKAGTLSFWFRATAGDASNQLILNAAYGTAGGVQLYRLSSGLMQLVLLNSSNANILLMKSAASTFYVADGWKNILMSWNLATTTAQLYVQDASDANVVLITNDTPMYTSNQWLVSDPGAPITADLADLYLDTVNFTDFSVTGNRRKFITAGLSAVDLGATGQLPSGSAPICCLKGPTTSFLTNVGTGGNFSANTGTILAAGTNPP